MLFVKIKNTTEENITFEVITRSPLNYKEFNLDRSFFNEVFASSKNDMINTNISNSKENIFKCINALFEKKLDYWLKNIVRITPVFEALYEKDNAISGDRYMMLELKDEYKKEMGGDGFTFNKDFIFFRSLFMTSVKASYRKGDFLYSFPEVMKEGIYA